MKFTTFSKKLPPQLLDKNNQNKIIWLSFLLLGVLIFFKDSQTEAQNIPARPTAATKSADTYIPAGYTLVPVEIVNSHQVGSLIGDIGGNVDLYSTSSQGRKSKKVMENIRLLRAPLDPDNYAVLIREERVDQLLSQENRFFAVILNPNKTLPKVKEKKTSPQKIEIEYQEEL